MTNSLRAALLAALAFTALAACSSDGPVAPGGQKTANLGCQVNRVHADCGPVINPPGDTGTSAPPAASYRYIPIHNFYYLNGVKTVEIGAESDSYSYVSYTSVNDTVRASNCNTPNTIVTTAIHSNSANLSPAYVAAGIQQIYPDNYTYIYWSTKATHVFTVPAGVTGGGTYHTSWAGCI